MGFPTPSTAPPKPIPPKPPWYSTSTVTASLPTAVPNCNSLIESPPDTPATVPDDDDDDVDCFPRQDKQPVLQQQDISPTSHIANNTSTCLIESPTDTSTTENRQNKSENNNNNDCPDDDNDNDVDCFPRQDKQPVLPQDISPTDTLPSLIESTTDTPTAPMNLENNNNNNKKKKKKKNNHDPSDDDDDKCFSRQATQPVLQQYTQEQQGYSFSLPAITYNPTRAPPKRTTKITRPKQSAQRPDDDNNNNNDDVDCFPRQDKQPVLLQDISPNDTPCPSLIESITDTRPATENCKNKSDDNIENNTNVINPTIHPHDCPRWQQEHRQLQAMFPQLITAHAAAPTPIRPISTWNGTTHTDIVYDDDDNYDGRTDYDYAYGDSFNMNDPSVRVQFKKCLRAVQAHNDTTELTHVDPPPIKQTTMKHTHEDPPPPYMYDTLQLLFLTTHYENTNEYIDAFPLYTVPHYITRKKHPSHDNYLYRRWNNPTAHSKKTRKTNQRILARSATTKDDTSVTPTLQTLCTQDTRSSTQTDADILLSITIWNQPIVQYQTPIRSFASRHRSREHTSIAVQYALIGVYDKQLHPRKSPCLSYLFITRISCVVLSCFILLADSFTMVKIDDRYPDEWND